MHRVVARRRLYVDVLTKYSATGSGSRCKANSEAGSRKKIAKMSERRLSERRVARSESGEVLRQRFREGLRQAKDGRRIEIGDDKSEEPSRR